MRLTNRPRSNAPLSKLPNLLNAPQPPQLLDDDDEEFEEDEPLQPPTRRAAIPVSLDLGAVDSPRLRRMSQYFSGELDLIDQMRSQVEQETAPLVELLIRQRQTMQQMLANLEERLGPLEAYAESEESNLASLQDRLTADSGDFLARSFADYVTLQRGRIEETRGRIEQQRQPLRRFSEDQRAAVEVALSRFDEDMSSLEEILSEQRRVMMRMLDAMRSESFLAVKDFLAERHEALSELAERRVTDPAAIGEALRAHRGVVSTSTAASTPGAEHVSAVLRSTDSADQQFVSSAPGAPGVSKAPRAMRPSAKPAPSQDNDDEEEATEEPKAVSKRAMPPAATDLLAERA